MFRNFFYMSNLIFFVLKAQTSLPCKSYLSDSYISPLDICFSEEINGEYYSFQYSCNSNKTGVIVNIYSGEECLNTYLNSTYTTDISIFNCDGDSCNNVAEILIYNSNSCNTSNDYSNILHVTEECISSSSATSYFPSCSNGNITYYYYSNNNCSGIADYNSTLFYDNECDDDNSYTSVTCNGGDASTTQVPLTSGYFTTSDELSSTIDNKLTTTSIDDEQSTTQGAETTVDGTPSSTKNITLSTLSASTTSSSSNFNTTITSDTSSSSTGFQIQWFLIVITITFIIVSC